MAVLVAALTSVLVALCWQALAGGGWTGAEILIFLCFAANAPWLALMAVTGYLGALLHIGTRDVSALVVPAARAAPPDMPIASSVVLALCIRLEDPRTTLPSAEALLQSLRSGPDGDCFRLAILSDTPDGPEATVEHDAATTLMARHPDGAVFYRRRGCNVGFKAGNLMDFLDHQAGQAEFILTLDADSVMSAGMVRRLVRIMQADPGLALLQASIAGCHARSRFAAMVGIGHRYRSRTWAIGQAWWQGPAGPYWGHNALIRVAAFRRHARLPLLPGGQPILSHDLVEAALLQGAGWAVRVLPEDEGSAERHPPDLLALLQRDVRWAKGNLQYLHLLARPEMGPLGRLQMLQAILYYALAPMWLALLPLTAINVMHGGGTGTSRAAVISLLAAAFIASNLPKLGGFAVACLREARPPVADMAREIAFSVLMDPVMAADRGLTALQLLRHGRGASASQWEPQQREAGHLPWMAALRRLWPHTALGLLASLCLASSSWFAFLAALPATAGLIMAIPLCVLTARPVRSPTSASRVRTVRAVAEAETPVP